MTGDNPFAEPEDDDHTVIIPRSALSGLARRDHPDAERPRPVVDDADFSSINLGGGAAVITAASPLLSLIARLRNVVSTPDPGALRECAIQELRRYEATLREAKVAPDDLRLGHYVLCTSLDDVVQCTPWGSQGPWAEISLTSAFHRDVHGGERFFEILGRLLASPGRYLPLIELMYLCMSLGMHGKYRLSPRGPAELDRVREETYAVIRSLHGAVPPELSPHWQGLAARFRPLRFEMPLWLAALVGGGLLALAYALLVVNLAAQSDVVFEAADSLPPAAMPALLRPDPARPPPPDLRAGLRHQLLDVLSADIRDGQLFVEGNEAVPILRLQSEGMFELGSATVDPRYLPVLQRIADAIGRTNGAVRVIGYTDNQPIHTIAFPSNYNLSLARARAASQVIGGVVSPARIRAVGRGEQAPRADNATADGRRSNRRVEIVVESTDAN